ncbi:MAG: flagellar hook-length control protein FliK [Pseudomonadota bacterium]|nr:flagellar hook-length control protein FliK [Pseudomonadota bacterium]MDO7711178.1 flagellar hook-length control protein FliK [Pseudomonadota bacterium]
MAQAFLLKTDVAMISSNASQNHTKNQARDFDEIRMESFSSALDRQVDKHDIQQHKKPNKADDTGDTLVTSDNNVDSKEVVSGEKKGQALPVELEVIAENQFDIDENQLAVTEKVSFSIPEVDDKSEIEVEPELVINDFLNVALNIGAKSDDAIAVGHHTALTLVGEAGAIKKNVLETNKVQTVENAKLAHDIVLANKVDTAPTKQQNEHPEQKQQAQSLRSDILNALLKKPNAEGDKLAAAVEQKIVTNSPLIPINKEGLSEEQKIIALATNLKLKGSTLKSSVLERSATVPSVLLTPAVLGSNAVSSNAVLAQPILNLQPALQSEAWSRVLSSRVIWMAREGVQQASLKLNPANMGSVEVKLHIHNDQANISFIVQHASTRDALEQALPRLRDSFQESGLELAHADVSQENFSETDEQDNNKTTNNGSKSESDNVDTETGPTTHDVNLVEQDIALGLNVFA